MSFLPEGKQFSTLFVIYPWNVKTHKYLKRVVFNERKLKEGISFLFIYNLPKTVYYSFIHIFLHQNIRYEFTLSDEVMKNFVNYFTCILKIPQQ